MKFKHIHIFFAIIIIVGGGILLTSHLELFDTDRSAEPLKLTEDVYDIADIRGSFTMAEIEKFYQVPPQAIIEAFNLKADTDPSLFKLKDLKEIYQEVEVEGETYAVETDTVKVFVSLYSDIPYTSEETSYLPERAVEYLIKEDKLSQEEQNYWKNHTFKLALIEPDKEHPIVEKEETTQPVTEEETKTISITGKMTIAEILAMGINEEKFKEITGLEVPEDKTLPIRDFFSSQDLEFSLYKEKLESFLLSSS
jgi:hypothetical protein